MSHNSSSDRGSGSSVRGGGSTVCDLGRMFVFFFFFYLRDDEFLTAKTRTSGKQMKHQIEADPG